MAQNPKLIVFPVKDLSAAKAFYKAFLGTDPYADGDFYVGYKTDTVEVGLDPHGEAVIAYIEVDDIHATLKTLLEVGASTHKEVTDVGGGMLIAQVKESSGNILGLRQFPK